jgi:hypothetical protein
MEDLYAISRNPAEQTRPSPPTTSEDLGDGQGYGGDRVANPFR